MKETEEKNTNSIAQRTTPFFGSRKSGSFFTPTIQRNPLSGGGVPWNMTNSARPEDRFSLTGNSIPSPSIHRSILGISATVYFGQDSIFLNSENNRVVESLNQNLEILHNPRVIVNSHASSEGSQSHNQQLSEQRRSLVIALLSNNNPPTPINFSGQAFGESTPAVPESATTETELESQRGANRRVEISILYDPSTISSPDAEDGGAPNIQRPNLLRLPPGTRERLWQEEQNRRMWQTPILPPIQRRSLNDALNERIDNGLNRVFRRLNIPEWMHGPLRNGAKAAVSRGANALLDSAMDGVGLEGEARDAVQAAVRAAAQADIIPSR